MSGLLLKSERLSFHKQSVRLEKLTKQALWSYSLYKLAQAPSCYLYISDNSITSTTAATTPTHHRKSKQGNSKLRHSKHRVRTPLTDSLCSMHSIKMWNRLLDCSCPKLNVFRIITKTSSFTWGRSSLKNRYTSMNKCIFRYFLPAQMTSQQKTKLALSRHMRNLLLLLLCWLFPAFFQQNKTKASYNINYYSHRHLSWPYIYTTGNRTNEKVNNFQRIFCEYRAKNH